jgi:NADPH:quinone reductase-like Zn-dependent oxidoreductase
MKAAVYTKYGPPNVLQLKEVDKPIPKDNEVLIRIYATTVSADDPGMRNGDSRILLGLTRPRNSILGTEFSGEIEIVGKDVKLYKGGDHVFGNTGTGLGCYAEYRCVPEDGLLSLKPGILTFEEAAAATCEGPLPSWNFLKDKANIQRGQRVLIIGASGSIGTAAVQIAKYFGAKVTGVCNTPNIELVKTLGAAAVIDDTKEDFTKNDQTFDIIFDTEGRSSFSKCKGLLSINGVYLSFFISLSILLQTMWTSKFGSKKAVFSATGLLPITTRLNFLKELTELFEEGNIRPVIDRCYPLDQISEAHRYIEQGAKKGSVVITLEHTN